MALEDREAHYNYYGGYRKYAIRCAYDLGYPKVVIERLEKAVTDGEVSRIMCDARNGVYGGIFAE